MGKKKSRKVQEINAGSMADIAFLMLIFFLVTTTMDTDAGIQRILPPMSLDKNDQTDVNKRNVLLVFVSRSDAVMIGQQYTEIPMIKDLVKEFVLNPYDDPTKSAKKMTPIEGIGEYPVSEGIVSLQNDRGTSYDTYIQVQNELTRAFNEIRDEVAIQKFGVKFNELDEEKRNVIQKAVPLKISEAEPRNIGGV